MRPDEAIQQLRGGSVVNDIGQGYERGEIDSGTVIDGVLLLIVVPPLVLTALNTLTRLASNPNVPWLFAVLIILLIIGIPIAAIVEKM